MDKKYNVFTRRFWRANPNWPGKLEPHMGRKTYLRNGISREDAVRVAQDYNSSHKPGKYSRKAEIEAA